MYLGFSLVKKKKYVCVSFVVFDNKFDDELMIFIKILLNYIEYLFWFKKNYKLFLLIMNFKFVKFYIYFILSLGFFWLD